jgi:hypothetical protein
LNLNLQGSWIIVRKILNITFHESKRRWNKLVSPEAASYSIPRAQKLSYDHLNMKQPFGVHKNVNQ